MRRNNLSILCPALIINRGRYPMSRRSSSQNIHNHTFIVSMHRKVHGPAICGAPMPIKHILPVLTVKVPVYLTPQFINTCRQLFFIRSAIYIILMHSQQALHQKSSFHQVTAIIFGTERQYFACLTIPPVRISPMKTVGFLKESHNLVHSFEPFLPAHIAPVYTGQNSHDAKTTSSRGYHLGPSCGIYIIYMITLTSHTAIRFAPLPEILESTTLDSIHQSIIGKRVGRRCRTLVRRSCRLVFTSQQ